MRLREIAMLKNHIVGGNALDMDSIRLIQTKDGLLILNLNSLDTIKVSYFDISKNELISLANQLSNEPYFKTLELAFNNQKGMALTIVPSFDCNYSCSYCYQNNRKNDINRMRVSDIKYIECFVNEYLSKSDNCDCVENISILGGEPLLPDNKEIIHSILKTWQNCKISITTNGTYINDFIRLLDNENIMVRVSLDGTEEMHYSRRITKCVDAYNNAILGIRKLLDMSIRTTIIAVFNPEWCNDYPKFFDLLDSLGWRKDPNLVCAFIPEIGCGMDDISAESVENNINAYIKLIKLDNRAKFMDSKKLMPGALTFLQALNLKEHGYYFPYRCSSLTGKKLTFLPDGSVSVCLAIPNGYGNIGTYKPNINIEWDKLSILRERRIDKMSKCKECSMKLFCMGGCFATSVNKTKDILGTTCELWENPTYHRYLECFM